MQNDCMETTDNFNLHLIKNKLHMQFLLCINKLIKEICGGIGDDWRTVVNALNACLHQLHLRGFRSKCTLLFQDF